jgi:hypothetical protein
MDFCRACATRNRLFWLIYMQNGALRAPLPLENPAKIPVWEKIREKFTRKATLLPPHLRSSQCLSSKYSKTTANALSHSSPGNVSINTKRKHVHVGEKERKVRGGRQRKIP